MRWGVYLHHTARFTFFCPRSQYAEPGKLFVVFLIFAGLVRNGAGGFAGGLAGSLAFAAACTGIIVHAGGVNCLYVFHFDRLLIFVFGYPGYYTP